MTSEPGRRNLEEQADWRRERQERGRWTTWLSHMNRWLRHWSKQSNEPAGEPESSPEQKAVTTRDLLGHIGWILLGLFAVRWFTSMLPFRILAPDWYVQLGIELVNTSPVMLTGFALISLAAILNLRSERNRQPRRALARVLAQLALAAYALLIPVQVVASILVDLRFHAQLSQQWDQVQRQLTDARQRQTTAPQLSQLERAEVALREQRGRGSRQMRLNLFRELVRVLASAMVMVVALVLPVRVLNERHADE